MVRPVVPSDRDELRREFLRLSPESHYSRFLGLGPAPTDELLTYLTCVDQQNHVAICATIESSDLKSERGIGIARFIRIASAPDTAEMAITVVDDMHRRGVGSVLLRELILAARLRGISTVRAEVLATNEAMRSILERAGAKNAEVESGEGCVAYDLAIGEVGQRLSLFDVLRAAAQGLLRR
jgi:RimJ/RimL family protein N-acetyltransferase